MTSKEGKPEMKKIIAVLFIIILCLASTACTKRVFGVSEDHWNTLTPAQQTEVIRSYNERERINAERRLAAQRQAAEDAEAQRVLAEAKAERIREHIDDIYAGRAGVYGDLVRVTIKNPERKPVKGRHDILPQSFLLADGEEKPIKLRAGHRTVTLWVSYLEGNLDLRNDPNSHRPELFQRFAYEPGWGRGKVYHHINLGKKSTPEIDHISVVVQVVSPIGKRHRR
jgi:hypothetical protein